MPDFPETPQGSEYKTPTGGSGDLTGQVKHDAAQTKETLKQEAKKGVGELKSQAKMHATSGKEQASEQIDKLSDTVDSVANALSDEHREGLASYAHEMSGKLSSLAGQLQERSVEQLVDDARNLARNNPAAFLLGSVAVGFGLSRFFKASDKQTASSREDETPTVAATPASPTTYPGTPGGPIVTQNPSSGIKL